MESLLLDPTLFIVGVVGFGGTLLGVIGLTCRSSLAGQRVSLVTSVFGVLVLAWGLAAIWNRRPTIDWLPLLLLAAVCLALAAARSSLAARLTRVLLGAMHHPIATAVVLLLLCPLLAFWWAQHLDGAVEETYFEEFGILDSSQLTEVSPSPAMTDLGTALAVYEGPQTYTPDMAEQESVLLRNRQLLKKVISTAPPDTSHNCHGWVFGSGRYWVRSDSIPTILRENGYRQVERPEVGDLIIYRNQGGDPIHSGVVRALGQDGLVLVESKWGWLGRYMHRPLDQCYSDNFAYYHSDTRQWHRLRGLRGETPDSLSPRPAAAAHD